jgi:hypothetical protein
MKRSKITVAAGLLVASLVGSRARAQAVLPPAENYKLRLEAFTWGSTIEGQIQKGFGTTSGTLLDLNDDLGVGNERTWAGDASIQFAPGLKLRGSYTEIEYSGDTTARQNFTFGDDQYFVGEHVVTSIKGKYYTAALEWDFVKKPQGFLGVFLGAKILDGDFVVVAPESGKRDVESGIGGLPVLGIATRLYSGKRFSAETEYSGMTIGSRGSVWELYLSARFHLSDRLAAMGGYRRLRIRGEPTEGRDFVEVRLSGAIFGVELSL